MTGEDKKPPLSYEELCRLYPQTAGDFIKSILIQGRRFQQQEAIKWLEEHNLVKRSPYLKWQAFKNLEIK